MGIDLTSDKGSQFRFSHQEWEFNLNLAQAYDWEPQGTRKPKGYGFFKRWHGRYDTNDGQYVLAADAENLAAALNRAIRSKHRQQVAKKVSAQMENTLVQMLGGPLPNGFFLPTDVDIENVIDFCAFCKKGGFYIE